MRKVVLALGIILGALVLAAPVSADNYGCKSNSQCAAMAKIIYAKFGTGWQGQTALRVARCESGLNPRAANWGDGGSVSAGLFQINYTYHHRQGESMRQFVNRMSIPANNVDFAYRLSRGGTRWSPWSCA